MVDPSKRTGIQDHDDAVLFATYLLLWMVGILAVSLVLPTLF